MLISQFSCVSYLKQTNVGYLQLVSRLSQERPREIPVVCQLPISLWNRRMKSAQTSRGLERRSWETPSPLGFVSVSDSAGITRWRCDESGSRSLAESYEVPDQFRRAQGHRRRPLSVHQENPVSTAIATRWPWPGWSRNVLAHRLGGIPVSATTKLCSGRLESC
jgi:hypothetical protein